VSEAGALFDEMYERFLNRKFRDHFHEAEWPVRLLIAIYREQVSTTRTNNPAELGYHYLKSHFRMPINLKLVADKRGVSREHLIRAFGNRYSETPGAMPRRLRLELATMMLSTTRMPAQETALACGFADAGTFSRAYRRMHGSCPREIRPH
jgi:transcriptional regulator GlxA family with amidase domain